MKFVREYEAYDRGKFKGQSTRVYRCETGQHRFTTYALETAPEAPAVEEAPRNRDRLRGLLERAEALAS